MAAKCCRKGVVAVEGSKVVKLRNIEVAKRSSKPIGLPCRGGNSVWRWHILLPAVKFCAGMTVIVGDFEPVREKVSHLIFDCVFVDRKSTC